MTVSVERERKQGDIVTFLVSFVVFRRRPNKLASLTVLLVPIPEMPGSELGRNTNFETRAYPQFLQQIPEQYLKYAPSLSSISSPFHFACILTKSIQVLYALDL